MLAIQGPKSIEVIESLNLKDALDLKPLTFIENVKLNDLNLLLVSRSGWTGEDGFELWVESSKVEEVWAKLLATGCKPAGLAVRDTLRMEMGYVLYGEDIDEEVTPIEARYWVFSYDKRGYIGYEALVKKMEEGVNRVRVGFKMKKRIVPRHGCKIYIGEKMVGHVTSGMYSPMLKVGIAQGYMNVNHAIFGMKVDVEVRGKRYRATIVDFPFIKR